MINKKLRGKPVAKEIYKFLKSVIEAQEIVPKLAILLMGDDPAAEYYVQMLQKKGRKIGIEVQLIKLETAITQNHLLAKIEELNSDESIHGIMLQKPLPKQIDEVSVINSISPIKDVDAFHPLNIGKMVLDLPSFIPCTPAAVLKIIGKYEIETESKNIVILGRSNIVGKPLANLLIRKNKTGNATVTICHSRTRDLIKFTSKADILIAAIGKPLFVTDEMIKKDSIIIDVGVNLIKDDNGNDKYVGDVDYNRCFEKASAITPVPGGIGTVTTAMLLQNVVAAADLINNSENLIDGIKRVSKSSSKSD